MWEIPFHKPWRSASEEIFVVDALRRPQRQGGGYYTKSSQAILSQGLDGKPVLLTQSCTAALEFAALLMNIGPGDEVIVPSYTFTSTATAFAIRGARLVFVDIDSATQNIDPQWIASAITPRTRAIVAMHYGGVACDMRAIESIAAEHNIMVVEDAAQAIGARAPDGRALGAIGAIGALSFHDTKNVSSGEGGAVVLGETAFLDRAEILWEKGTDRSKFVRQQVDKYTWVDIGSSFLPSEITAAMLLAQLGDVETVNAARLSIWQRYHVAFADLACAGAFVRPHIPDGAVHNAHLYYLVLHGNDRDAFIAHLAAKGVQSAFHYVPLHTSTAGKKFGRVASPMTNSTRAGDRLVRLPLWPGMSDSQVDAVVTAVRSYYSR